MKDIFDKRIITVPKPEQSIGVDTEDKVIKQVAEGEDVDGLQSLTTVSLERDRQYNQVDDMCNDSRIASILEIYAEDTACIGDDGRIVYVDSTDSNVSKMITHFLDAMQIDKYIYSWAYSLIKYGDVYIRLFRESETNPENNKDRKLNEQVEVKYYNNLVDHYSDYCQQVLNPAEMFDLKKFGQTYAYIQCPITSLAINVRDRNQIQYLVQYKDMDVKLFQSTSFVHGSLNQSQSRVAETIELFGADSEDSSDTYTVNKGQSLFYNVYPIWRQMQLLENAMLLNRINKAAILRIMQVEVGNVASEEEINSIVTATHQMLQTKMSLSTNAIQQLYNSDQPTVQYAVMPMKNGKGALSTLDVGGDTGENNLDDVDYFKNKLFSALRVPKQLVGETGTEGAGFDAGGSLAQLSYRYGKAVRRIQNVLIQMITDMMNLRLYDRGLDAYINKFAIKMHFPVTQEDTINQTHKKEQVDLVMRIMDSLEDVVDDAARVRVLRYLLPTVVDNSDVLTAVTSELEKGAQKLDAGHTPETAENMEDREGPSREEPPMALSSAAASEEIPEPENI